ncbi:MAG TPA: PilZ domain-containing protein [Sphingomicrobium sp.]|nr:PilZ domain-containing protein [Sphingomicrobium sp.]
MTDASSVTTVVLGDRLPWPDEAWPADEKGPFDSGAIYICGARQPCSIRKISALGVTVSSNVVPALGERASIELATGQRAPGKVAWTGRNELGLRFDDSIDVIALLNRKLVSQARERRTMPRLEVRCPIHVKSGGQFWIATLRNISARGLQIEGDELPAVGAYVSPFVEGLNIPPGEVVWKRGGLVGVEVMEELSWTSIIPWVRKTVQAQR